MSLFGMSFPFLPLSCGVCSKWGHNEKDCQLEIPVEILKKPHEKEQQEVTCDRNQEVGTLSGKEVVAQLLNELEKFPVTSVLQESVVKNFGKDLRLFLNNLSSGTEPEKWVTMGGQSHNSSQGTKLVGKGCLSKQLSPPSRYT